MRASTTQSAISRIERNRISPSVATLQDLLFLLGEDLVLDAKPRETDVDVEALEERLSLTPEERIQRGIEDAGRVLAEKRRQLQKQSRD